MFGAAFVVSGLYHPCRLNASPHWGDSGLATPLLSAFLLFDYSAVMALLPFICKGYALSNSDPAMGFKSPRLRPGMPVNSKKFAGIPPRT